MNQRHEEVITLYLEKFPLREIAAITDYSYGYIYHILHRHSIPTHQKRITRHGVEMAVEQYLRGDTIESIIYQTRISRSGLYKALKDRDIPLRQS